MPQNYQHGLYTKLLQSGDPAYITKKGIYQSVKNHVSPTNEEELKFYNTSHFLSFSECKNKAKWYASDKDEDPDCEGKEYPERRYIFTLDLSRVQIKSFHKYIFDIFYSCYNGNCETCQGRKNSHQILILDVVSILKENPSYQTDKQALASAEQDKEWLVLPFDYKPELFGHSAKILPSNFWTVEFFGYYSEDAGTFFG